MVNGKGKLTGVEIQLRKVTHVNFRELASLTVAETQRGFVAANAVSIMEAYVTVTEGGVALPFGIYAGDLPVGFLMIGFDCLDWEDAPAVAKGAYSLWRLMIDARYQGHGYGRQALAAALAYMRAFPCGPAERCWLSYEPDNLAAKRLYHSFGFVENGEMDGNEVVAVLCL